MTPHLLRTLAQTSGDGKAMEWAADEIARLTQSLREKEEQLAAFRQADLGRAARIEEIAKEINGEVKAEISSWEKEISALETRHAALLKQNVQQEAEIDALEQRNRELEAIQAQANAILDNHRNIVEAKDAELLKLRTAIKNAPHANLCANWDHLPCDCWKKEAEEALKTAEAKR